jgi:methionyl aminopeptidase
MAITIKNEQDIEKMRIAGKLASEVLDFITPYVKPGVTTGELDKLCHDYMVNVQKTIPAPLNYAPPGHVPYPKSICTSVNHQICHGVPGDKVLKNSDVVNLDITVIKDGYHGDTSRMFYVGEPSIQAKRLCEVTYECMWLGIAKVKPGATLGDIGYAIQSYAEKNGFSVVQEFCGPPRNILMVIISSVVSRTCFVIFACGSMLVHLSWTCLFFHRLSASCGRLWASRQGS